MNRGELVYKNNGVFLCRKYCTLFHKRNSFALSDKRLKNEITPVLFIPRADRIVLFTQSAGKKNSHLKKGADIDRQLKTWIKY